MQILIVFTLVCGIISTTIFVSFLPGMLLSFAKGFLSKFDVIYSYFGSIVMAFLICIFLLGAAKFASLLTLVFLGWSLF